MTAVFPCKAGMGRSSAFRFEAVDEIFMLLFLSDFSLVVSFQFHGFMPFTPALSHRIHNRGKRMIRL
jgi:hypothetical protein